jgi:membrane fusion protein
MNSASKPPLFRKESYSSAQSDEVGQIVLTRPVSFTMISIFFLVVFTIFVIYAIFGTYSEVTRISGFVMPQGGMAKITSEQGGAISELHAHEGQSVHKGDLLFVVSLERANIYMKGESNIVGRQLAVRRDSFKSERLQQELISKRHDLSLQAKIDSLKNELAELDGEIDLQRRRISLSRNTVETFKDLETQKFSSSMQTQQKEEELLDKQSALQTLLRSRTALELDISTARQDLDDDPIRQLKDREDSERSISTVEQELSENELKGRVAILAPEDGTVSSVMVAQGQSIQAGEKLLDILPNAPVWQVQLFANSKAIGNVKAGARVVLRYQAFPFQKFGLYGGSVSTASLSPQLSSEYGGATGGKPAEPFYRVDVALDQQSVKAYGETRPLRVGMQVEADIQGDRRRIIDWVLDPIYSFNSR